MTPDERIRSAVSRMQAHSAAVDILHLSFSKVLSSPHTERFRKVSLAHPAFRDTVGNAPGGMELMFATGWESHHGHLLLQTFDKRLLAVAVEALDEIRATSAAYRSSKDDALRQKAADLSVQASELEAAKARAAYAKKVPPEPDEGETGSTWLCVHLADGTHKWRRFESWNTLSDLESFVRTMLPQPNVPLKLTNVTTRPSLEMDMDRQRGTTLHGLDLWPSGHVRVTAVGA